MLTIVFFCNFFFCIVVFHRGSAPNNGHYIAVVVDYERDTMIVLDDTKKYENPLTSTKGPLLDCTTGTLTLKCKGNNKRTQYSPPTSFEDMKKDDVLHLGKSRRLLKILDI